MEQQGLIGIVSGLGPLAGSDVLDKALEYAAESYDAIDDADYPDIVLFSHGIEDFDATGSMDEAFLKELVGVVQEIELHHPTVLGIACNTAHMHFAELSSHTEAVMVNLIEATAEAAGRVDRNYLLLSSSATRRTRMYHRALEARGVRFTDVTDAVQLEVDEIVHAVMSHTLDAAGCRVEALVGCVSGYDAIIAGCTELPIAFDHSNVSRSIPVVDSNRVLARGLVDTYFRLIQRTRPFAAATTRED